jgi:hypothetical protein
MVCLCGSTFAKRTDSLLDRKSNTLSYRNWQRLSINFLYNEIYEHATFGSLVDSLLRSHATESVVLLRSRFVGFLDVVKVTQEQKIHADFLTAEGALVYVSDTHYRMASPLIDGLIRTKVIPVRFPTAPSTNPPFRKSGESLDILKAVVASLEVFDKELIRLAPSRSHKSSKVIIGGSRGVLVPRESVYDSELMRILSNWLKETSGWTVTGQWHLQTTLGKHKYTYIVVQKDDKPPTVLELVATGDASFVQSHIRKIPEYMDLLSAEEAWVIHFTCEDNYDPIWQSDDELNKGVNVVHFFHDLEFTKVWMMARWRDDTGVRHDDGQWSRLSV